MEASKKNLTSKSNEIVVVTGKKDPLVGRSRILVEIEREMNRFNTFYRNALNAEGEEREVHIRLMRESIERIKGRMEKEDVPKTHKSWDWVRRMDEMLTNM